MCIRDQALLYYRLLHCGIEETRKVLQGRRSDPSLGVLIGRPAEPISQWSGSFNTLEPLRQLSAVELESVSPQTVTFDPRPNSDLPDSFQCSSVVHSGESRRSSDSRTIMAPVTNVPDALVPEQVWFHCPARFFLPALPSFPFFISSCSLTFSRHE